MNKTAHSSSRNVQSRKPIVVTASAFLITMMGTTLPTPLYSIYAAKLAFSAMTVTILFAVYAIGVVATLILFGRLSDEIGRKPVLLLAVGLAVVSAGLFLLPPSLPLLIVARIISGVSAGLMSGAGTAAIIDLFPPQRKPIAGMLAIAVNTGGLAIGTLVSGVIADTGIAPLVLPYLIQAIAAIVALITLWRHTPSSIHKGRFRIRAQRLRVPAAIRGAFLRGVLGAGTGFAVCGVLTAVSALFLAQSLHLTSHALAGFVVFLAFAGMATGQVLGRKINPRVVFPLGCAGMILAATCLAIALAATTLIGLLAGAIVAGFSGGLCLNAALAMTVEQVPPTHRGEVSSSLFAGLYSLLALPPIGIGIVARLTDLRTGGLLFTGFVAVLAAVVGLTQFISARNSYATKAVQVRQNA